MTTTPDPLREGLAEELMSFRWGPGTPSDRHDFRVRQRIALQEADKIRALLAETAPAVEEDRETIDVPDEDGLMVTLEVPHPRKFRSISDSCLMVYIDGDVCQCWLPIGHDLDCLEANRVQTNLDTLRLASPPAPHGDETGAVEVTDAMVERGYRVLIDVEYEHGDYDQEDFRAALTAALTPEES